MNRLRLWLSHRLVRYVPVVIRADVERVGQVTITRLPGGWARVTYDVKTSRHNPTRPRR